MTETYAKVATDLAGHDKWLGLTLASRGLWISGLLYTKLHHTGGFIPISFIEHGLGCTGPLEQETISALIARHLWDIVPAGYQMHDWEAHQSEPPDYSEMGRRSAEKRRAKYGSAQPEPRSNGVRTAPTNAPEVTETEQNITGTNVPAKVARRDELFEAICEGCEVNWRELTPAGRGAANKAKSDLAAVGATPEEVRRRAAAWADYLPNARLTPSALAKHWGALGDVKPPQTQQERDRETIAQRYAGGGIVVDMEGTT